MTVEHRIPMAAARTVALAGALLLLSACGSSSGGPQTQPTGETTAPEVDAIAVRVTAVVRVPLSSLYSTSATMRADRHAVVTARTHGVVRRLLVEEGHRVKEGQALAALEDEEQRIEFEKTTATRDNEMREHARAESLHAQGLLSDEEYDTTRREAEEAGHTASLAELMLARTIIRAPIGGMILARHLDVGDTVSDGTPVFDLADLDPLYVDVNVPERQIGRLAAGQAVRLVADSSGESAEATIERIAPVVDATTGTVKVTLTAAAASHLRPGSFVRVEIVTDTHEDALVVPRSALVAEGRRWHLFRIDDETGTVQRVEVRRGYEEGERVEILDVVDADRTLTAGDRVVSVGASALTDGTHVQVIEEAPPASSRVDETGPGDRVAT